MVLQVNGKEEIKNKKFSFSKNIILWHKKNGRHDLPWQINKTPYSVWISEIMLQQTQVKTVLPYYKNFLNTYPSIKKLADSNLDDILKLWTGLGYYRRAENIYKTSQILKNKYKYTFPKIYEEIIELPGIGRSTAGAILSLAYNKKYPILDGNVKRVIKRFFAIKGDHNKEKNLWILSEKLLPNHMNDIYTQSIMDLGSLVCLKKNPLCSICPVKKNCKSLKLNIVDEIPEKIERKKRKEKILYWFVIQNKNEKDKILMKKNTSKSIWSNLWCLPSFDSKEEYDKFLKEHLITSDFNIFQSLEHNLTHLKLKIYVTKIQIKQEINSHNFYWKNIYDKIGCPKPVETVIKKLKME